MLVIFGLALLAGCTKTDLNKHYPIETGGPKPGIISNIKVINKPGAAIITYTLPDDANLQYVMAQYYINNTTLREAKSSRYTDTIHVDGFNKADEYTVTLYSVSKSEVRSDSVIVKVHPETPPYRTIAYTLKLNDDFGGVNVTFENSDESKIAIVIITKDNNNEFFPAETFYTQSKTGSYSVRGFDTIPRVFGVYIKDRWNNVSDTLFKEVHPMFERMLDKSKFRSYKLPFDQPSAWGWEMSNLWDGKTGEPGFHTLQGAEPHPHRFTFDMGVVAKLSRFKILQRSGDWFYGHGNPKKWIMWGTATEPNSSGTDEGWVNLMACESIKPSELPAGQTSNEDISHARGIDGLGEEFTFPLSAPPVRYIRMEILENWSGTDFFHALEVTFWGNPQ